MISYVSGILANKSPTEVVVDIHGLGYSILIPTSCHSALPKMGEKVKLFTYQHVREDALQLYGFTSTRDRQLYIHLISVSGVGPRLALACLSAYNSNQITQAIVNENADFLTGIPGIGKKSAQRLIIELKDKLSSGSGVSVSVSEEKAVDFRSDALSALRSLGLSHMAAEKAISATLAKNPDIEKAEDLVRLSLRSKS